MNCIRNITDDILYIGGSDRRLSKFENLFPIPRGISYNSYLILDEKTVLIDTVDPSISDLFFENLKSGLNGRNLDYLVVEHMEPDHAATLSWLIKSHPETTIICSAIAKKMISQFFEDIDTEKIQVVCDGTQINIGSRELSFFTAPMVHWPEVIVVYDPKTKVLFSADAFGSFGAMSGNIFADELDFEHEWLPDARRYYANIVGKYGQQTQALLKKASALDIKQICSLHGPIWRKRISWYIDKYQQWSTYTPEEKGVLIVYGSVYGHTQNAAEALAVRLADKGIKTQIFDASVTDVSELVSQCWRFSHIVLACATYNLGIFQPIEELLLDLKAHNFQNRTFAIIENGSWSPTSGKLISQHIQELKDCKLVEPMLAFRSSLQTNKLSELSELTQAISSDFASNNKSNTQLIDPSTMFKISYGLYVLSAKDGDKDNGCILNTVNQITSSPMQLAIAVNKTDFTHDMIVKTKIFNISILSSDVEFPTFKHFGYQSGRDVDKFADYSSYKRSENQVTYVTENCNAFISCEVIDSHDYGTHTLFIAKVTQAQNLTNDSSVTYADYFDHIKPKAPKPDKKIKGWRCKICGYIYEGEVLPPDFICPICKHPASDFEPIGFD